jgi:hypothetical protein
MPVLGAGSTSSKRRAALGVQEQEEVEPVEQYEEPAVAAASALASTSSKRRVGLAAATPLPPYEATSPLASTSSKRGAVMPLGFEAADEDAAQKQQLGVSSTSSKRAQSAHPLGAGEYLLGSGSLADDFHDYDAIRAAQNDPEAAAAALAVASQPEEPPEDWDESLHPRIVAGSVLVAEEAADAEDEEAERAAEEAVRNAAAVEREPPRPYGFLPFVKVTRNGFTREVRIPHFGDKHVDPPLSWLREKYRFAAPAGIHAFVTLHAYGYRVWAKNNVKF